MTIRIQEKDFDLGAEIAALRKGDPRVGAVVSFGACSSHVSPFSVIIPLRQVRTTSTTRAAANGVRFPLDLRRNIRVKALWKFA